MRMSWAHQSPIPPHDPIPAEEIKYYTMWKPSVLLAAALALPTQALHFYLDGAIQKCFYEELPKDTMVVGTINSSHVTCHSQSLVYSKLTVRWRYPGHYHAEAWSDQTKSYQTSSDVGVFVTVEETFDNNHRIVAQRGSSEGRFTFSAADSGQHRICVTPQNVPSGGGWLGTGVHGTVKFTLDLAIGETSKIESTDKDKVQTLVQKVQDLNSRLLDVRREQVFQRVCASYCGNLRNDANGHAGTRSRTHKLSRRPVDNDPARRPRRDVRMATFAFARLLHQAEAYVDSVWLGVGCVRSMQ
jgi:hypothetical protein